MSKNFARLVLALLCLCLVAAAPAVLTIRSFIVDPQPANTTGQCANAVRISTYVNSKFATCCNPSSQKILVGGAGLCTTVDGGFPICNGSDCTYHDCFECQDCSSSGVYVRIPAREDAGCLLDGGKDASTLNKNCAHVLQCVEGK